MIEHDFGHPQTYMDWVPKTLITNEFFSSCLDRIRGENRQTSEYDDNCRKVPGWTTPGLPPCWSFSKHSRHMRSALPPNHLSDSVVPHSTHTSRMIVLAVRKLLPGPYTYQDRCCVFMYACKIYACIFCVYMYMNG